MQQNSKSMICSEWDEIINPIVSECSTKSARLVYDWVRKVIHWEVYKKFIFDHTNKWYINNVAAVL